MEVLRGRKNLRAFLHPACCLGKHLYNPLHSWLCGRCARIRKMSSRSKTQVEPRAADDVVRDSQVTQSPNGVCYSQVGEATLESADLERLVAAVPRTVA